MKGEAWASYRAAMPPECFGEPDDEPPPDPRKAASYGPTEIVVNWLEEVEYEETIDGVTYTMSDRARTFRVFGAESWRWKHVLAWVEAMERRHGKGNVWVEEC